eukprot:g67295.t1
MRPSNLLWLVYLAWRAFGCELPPFCPTDTGTAPCPLDLSVCGRAFSFFPDEYAKVFGGAGPLKDPKQGTGEVACNAAGSVQVTGACWGALESLDYEPNKALPYSEDWSPEIIPTLTYFNQPFLLQGERYYKLYPRVVGGVPPFVFSELGSNLSPINLTLDSSTGTISGTVVYTGPSLSLSVQVMDSTSDKKSWQADLTLVAPSTYCTSPDTDCTFPNYYNQTDRVSASPVTDLPSSFNYLKNVSDAFRCINSQCDCPKSNLATYCGTMVNGLYLPSPNQFTCASQPGYVNGNNCPVSYMCNDYGDRAIDVVGGLKCVEAVLSRPHLIDNGAASYNQIGNVVESRDPAILFNPDRPYQLRFRYTGAMTAGLRFTVLVRPWPESLMDNQLSWCRTRYRMVNGRNNWFSNDRLRYTAKDRLPSRQHYLAIGATAQPLGGDDYYITWQPITSANDLALPLLGRPFRAALGDRREDWLSTLDSARETTVDLLEYGQECPSTYQIRIQAWTPQQLLAWSQVPQNNSVATFKADTAWLDGIRVLRSCRAASNISPIDLSFTCSETIAFLLATPKADKSVRSLCARLDCGKGMCYRGHCFCPPGFLGPRCQYHQCAGAAEPTKSPRAFWPLARGSQPELGVYCNTLHDLPDTSTFPSFRSTSKVMSQSLTHFILHSVCLCCLLCGGWAGFSGTVNYDICDNRMDSERFIEFDTHDLCLLACKKQQKCYGFITIVYKYLLPNRRNPNCGPSDTNETYNQYKVICEFYPDFWSGLPVTTIPGEPAITPNTVPDAFTTPTNFNDRSRNADSVMFYQICTTNATYYDCVCDPANATIGVCDQPPDFQCSNDPHGYGRIMSKRQFYWPIYGQYLASQPASTTRKVLQSWTPLGLTDNVTKPFCLCESGFQGRVCQVQTAPLYRHLELPVHTIQWQEDHLYSAPCAYPRYQAYRTLPGYKAYFESPQFQPYDQSWTYQGEPFVGVNCDIPTGHMLLVADMNKYRSDKVWNGSGTADPWTHNLPGLLRQELAYVLDLEECRIQVTTEAFPSGKVDKKQQFDYYFGVTIAAKCEHHDDWAEPSVRSAFSMLLTFLRKDFNIEPSQPNYGPLEVLSRVRGYLEFRSNSGKTEVLLQEFKTEAPESSGVVNSPDECILGGCGDHGKCNNVTKGCDCDPHYSGLRCHYLAPKPADLTRNSIKEFFNLISKEFDSMEANVHHGWVHMSSTNSKLTFHLTAWVYPLKCFPVFRELEIWMMVSYEPWTNFTNPESYLMHSREDALYRVAFNEKRQLPMGVWTTRSGPLDKFVSPSATDAVELDVPLSFDESGLFQRKVGDQEREPNLPLYFAILVTGTFTAHEMLMGLQREAYEAYTVTPTARPDALYYFDVDPVTASSRIFETFGPVSTGAYINWRSINTPTITIKVVVKLGDSVAQVLDIVAISAFAGMVLFLLVRTCLGRRKYGSTGNYLREMFKPTDLKRVAITEQERQHRRELRMQHKREEIVQLEMKGFDPFNEDTETKKDKPTCSFSIMGLLFFVVSALIRVLLEMIKLAFNVSILHTSLNRAFTLPDISKLSAIISEFFDTFGVRWMSGWFDLMMQIFSSLDFLRAVGEGWNCGGALALMAPVCVVLGCYLFFRILHDDLLLRLAIETRGQVVGKSRMWTHLKIGFSMLLSAIVLYLLQSVVLLMTSIVTTTIGNQNRSCSELDRAMVETSYIFAIIFSLISLYTSVLLFGGAANFSFRGLTLGWLHGLKAVTVLTLGIWTNDNVKRFRIVERANVYDNDETDRDNCQEQVMGLMGKSRALMWLPLPVVGIFITKVGEATNEAPGVVLTSPPVSTEISLLTPAWKRFILHVLSIFRFIATIYFTVMGTMYALRYMFASMVALVLVRVMPCYNYAKPKALRSEEELIVKEEILKERKEEEYREAKSMMCIQCHEEFKVPKNVAQFSCPHCKAVNGQMDCASCSKAFAVPASGAAFACPHCKAVNNRPLSIKVSVSSEGNRSAPGTPSAVRSRAPSTAADAGRSRTTTVNAPRPLLAKGAAESSSHVAAESLHPSPSPVTQRPLLAIGAAESSSHVAAESLPPSPSPVTPMEVTFHDGVVTPSTSNVVVKEMAQLSDMKGMSCTSCLKRFQIPPLQPATADHPAGPMRFKCPFCNGINARPGVPEAQLPPHASYGGNHTAATGAAYGGQQSGYGGQHKQPAAENEETEPYVL